MKNHLDVVGWSSERVYSWLSGLCDDPSWSKTITKSDIGGKELLLMTANDLKDLGANKVDFQELLLNSIATLRFYNFNLARETLQIAIFRLACSSRALHKRLLAEREQAETRQSPKTSSPKVTISSTEFVDGYSNNQRVSLDTLTNVSTIASDVEHITNTLNCNPFAAKDDYRTMKSLLLALSIELTSTAQRDQFVERPNDIIEKSAKALADYCDRIVHATNDPLLIQPLDVETVRLKRQKSEDDLGLVIQSNASICVHIIDKILPLSVAKKTNKLNEGDEVIFFNEYIIGWSAENVKKLLHDSEKMQDILIIVRKQPRD